MIIKVTKTPQYNRKIKLSQKKKDGTYINAVAIEFFIRIFSLVRVTFIDF